MNFKIPDRQTWINVPNSLIIGTHVETVFDHNPTPEELRYLFLKDHDETGTETISRDQETEYGNIYALYMIRGNREKALTYLDKIRDPKSHFSPPSPENN